MGLDDIYLNTIVCPIYGVEEDLNEFVNEFKNGGSPRFSDFALLWCNRKFIHLIHGRQTQRALTDILNCIFYHLVLNINSSSNTDIEKICSLYLLYSFYGKQPVRGQVRIRVSTSEWAHFVNLSKLLLKEEQLDAYYVFRCLCASSAFQFCALRQKLYPGAPLYNRSDIKLPISSVFCSKSEKIDSLQKSVAYNIIPHCLLEIPDGLKENLPAVESSVKQYVQAKEDIINNEPLVEYMASNGGDNYENAMDTRLFLGLNLVSFPESLNEIHKVLKEFHIYKNSLISESESNQLSSSAVQNSEGLAETEKDDIGKRRKRLRKTTGLEANL